MLTLKKARRIQRAEESKIIIKFLVFAVIIGIGSFVLFRYTDILSINSVFYLIPVALLLIAGRYTGIFQFFSKREFIGTVVKIDIYPVKEQKVKGAKGYTNFNHYLEAEILVRNEKGQIYSRILPNGDITSRLSEGDKIAFLRFIYEPVVINGQYWKKEL